MNYYIMKTYNSYFQKIHTHTTALFNERIILHEHEMYAI